MRRLRQAHTLLAAAGIAGGLLLVLAFSSADAPAPIAVATSAVRMAEAACASVGSALVDMQRPAVDRFTPLEAAGEDLHDHSRPPHAVAEGVVVRVLDQYANPAGGVPVILADASRLGRPGAGGLWATTDDESGVAVFEDPRRASLGDAGVVTLGCPVDHAPVHVDLGNVPVDGVVLQMQPTGTMRVRLVDPSGAAIVGPSADSQAVLSWRDADTEHSRLVRFEGGALSLDHVGVGVSVRLRLLLPDDHRPVDLSGPRHAGDLVEHPLRLSPPPTISGRLVDESGRAVAGQWVGTLVQGAPGTHAERFTTDQSGSFRIRWPRLPGHGHVDGLRLVLGPATADESTRLHQATTLLDPRARPMAGGDVDLGDLQLRPAPRLVAGSVVDDYGNPVAGATVVVDGPSGTEFPWSIPTAVGAPGISASDGSFRFVGHTAASTVTLRASAPGLVTDSIEVLSGSEGARVVLSSAGEVRIPIRFGAGLGAGDLQFDVIDTATDTIRSVAGPNAVEGGDVVWRALRRGRYRFTGRLLGNAEPVFVCDAIDVEPGGVLVLDEQVLDVDLHTIQVEIASTDGVPLHEASVIVDPNRLGDRTRAALPSRGGRVTVRTCSLPVDLLVLAPGYRALTVRNASIDTTVHLEHGYEVEVRAAVAAGLLGPEESLYARVVQDPPTDSRPHAVSLRGADARPWQPSHSWWLWSRPTRVPDDGAFTVSVPDVGAYVLEWELRGAHPGDRRTVARHRFTVDGAGSGHRVDVTVDDREHW